MSSIMLKERVSASKGHSESPIGWPDPMPLTLTQALCSTTCSVVSAKPLSSSRRRECGVSPSWKTNTLLVFSQSYSSQHWEHHHSLLCVDLVTPSVELSCDITAQPLPSSLFPLPLPLPLPLCVLTCLQPEKNTWRARERAPRLPAT